MGIILSEKCIVYTSDQIAEDPIVYSVFWTASSKIKNHFEEELEEA